MVLTLALRKKSTNSSTKFKADGMSIILVSSEMPEVLGMSDRILVMHEGRITGEFDAKDADQEKITRLCRRQKDQ